MQDESQYLAPYLLRQLLEDPVLGDLDPRVPHVQMGQRRHSVGQAVCPDDTELGIGAHKSQPNVNQLDEPR